MTDKEKIRNEIKKLKAQLIRGACSSQIAMETRCKEDAYNEVLAILDTLQEEPVSKDFEEALAKEWQGYVDREAATVDALEDNTQELAFAKGFYLGAKWQEQQFEKNRLAAYERQTEEQADIECDFVMSIIDNEHRQPTFDDAIKYGMTLQKEQMMKDAIKRTVKVDAGGFPYIDATELYDYIEDKPLAKDGEKVKLIIVKED